MWQYAERIARGGIPAAAALLEERSTSTRTNAVFSVAMVRERGCAAAEPPPGLARPRANAVQSARLCPSPD